MIGIRSAVLGDADEVWALARQFPQPKWPVSSIALFRSVFTEWLHEARRAILVAEDPQLPTLLGYVVGMDRRMVVDEAVAQVCELFVAEDHQGAGIGRLLVTHLEEWSRKRGCERVLIGGPVPRFYEALGYEQDGLFFSKAMRGGQYCRRRR